MLNIRVYGINNLATECCKVLCEEYGIGCVMLLKGKHFSEETAIALVDANYHESGYPIVFDGLTYVGGLDELKKYLECTLC